MKFIHEALDLGYDDLNATTLTDGRYYETPEGKYPSVTTVLKILSEDSINAWRARVGKEEADKISYRASTRGTAVHNVMERYLNNEDINKNEHSLDVVQSFNNLSPILDKRVGKIFAVEAALFSKHLRLAGRVDCVAEFDGVPSIIDFKTSRKLKRRAWIENYFIQASAYSIMFEERTGLPCPNLVILIDVDNEQPQIFTEHRDNWTKKLHETIEKYRQKKFWDIRGGM